MPLKDILIPIALAWFCWRAIRTPRDRALWIVVLALVAQLLGETVVITAIRELTGEALTVPVGKVIQNASLAISFFSLMLFFLLSAGGLRQPGPDTAAATQARRRAWREGMLLAGVITMLVLAVASTPAELRELAYPASGDLEDAALHRVEVTGFYVLALGYFAWAAAWAGRWALAYARESSPRTRVGLRFAALGMVCFGIAAGGRSAFALARFAGLAVPDLLTVAATEFVDVAVFCYIGGALYVGVTSRVAAMRVWVRHRRAYDALRPLWTALHEVWPDDELDRRPQPRGLWHDRVSPRQVHRRFWRRVIEIRDGLVRLSPHLADEGWSAERPAGEQARVFRAALDRAQAGVTPRSRQAVLVTAPTTTIDSDVADLVDLSRAIAPPDTGAA